MKSIIRKEEDIHKGSLILVNRQHPVMYDAPDELITIGDNILLERQAANLLQQLVTRIGGQACIVPVSGWRSLAEQQRIWDDTLQESGEEFTRTYVALPGCSEHQTGLAIDLGERRETIDFIRPEFPDTGICGDFRRLAADYGFTLRYPAGKELLTGIGHEPWHFRYVGIPHARIMAEVGLTLEEYIPWLRQFDSPLHPYCIRLSDRAVYISYIPVSHPLTRIEVNDTAPYMLSGNNVDGFILTQWSK